MSPIHSDAGISVIDECAPEPYREHDPRQYADQDPEEYSAAQLRVIEVDFRRDSRWIDFLSSHPDALIYHHPGWLSALEAEYRGKCIALACEADDGSFQGILPLLSTRGFALPWGRNQVGRRLSSLPRTPLAGPLVTHRAALAALLKAAVERVMAQPGLQLELKTTLPGLDKLVPELQCIRWRDTYVRGLPANDDPDLRLNANRRRTTRSCERCEKCHARSFGNSRQNHQVRWAVNKARKQGLSIRVAASEQELKHWYRLYLKVMRRNAVPPRPFRFFQHLWQQLEPLGHMELVVADSGESGMVSGSILLRFGHSVFWAFTGCDEDGFLHHANDLTLWHCLQESCSGGYSWFDLGEVAESHPELAQFKAKWGTTLQPLYRYYFPPCRPSESDEEDLAHNRLAGYVGQVWRRLPLSVVAAMGDWVFSYL